MDDDNIRNKQLLWSSDGYALNDKGNIIEFVLSAEVQQITLPLLKHDLRRQRLYGKDIFYLG